MSTKTFSVNVGNIVFQCLSPVLKSSPCQLIWMFILLQLVRKNVI